MQFAPSVQQHAHAHAQTQPGVPICRRCGVVAPRELRKCDLCSQPLEQPRAVSPPSADGTYWVAVRCSFQCRSCSFLSPLDALDVDGSVECAQCGMQQRFDVGAWVEALAFAHGVGDLAHPPPEGRNPHPAIWIGGDNPHIRVGYTETFGEHRQSSTAVEQGILVHRSLIIQAAPGHPVCRACAAPLATTVGRDGEVDTRCDRCGATAGYKLPGGAQKFADGLRGVVGAEHRTDQRLARRQTTAGGPIALLCPQCGAALGTSRERVVKCAFCNTTSLIPATARARDAGENLPPEVFWLVFWGPSAQRKNLESPPYPEPTEEAKDLVALTEGATSPEEIKKRLEAKSKEAKTPLELGEKRPGVYPPQLALRLVLPVIALALGLAITLLFGWTPGHR